ncbi:MAG: hypothetical protein DLM60_14455 [Pseudonocardiales bacterium]|nr:MAG: hypothetical protein DLM60_14455 [Pseudonocardiales bacterium]
MRRSSEPQERAQFTVAELLARYGDPAPTGGRRRRRAADDGDGDDGDGDRVADTAIGRDAAQPVVERNWASSPDSTQPHLTGPIRQQWAPAVGPPSPAVGRGPVAPPALPRRAPLPRTAAVELPMAPERPSATQRPSATPSDGPVTEQLPRLDPAPVNPTAWSSRSPASAYPSPRADPASSEPPAGLRTANRAIADPIGDAIATEEGQAQQAGSPLWEWAVMVSQVGIGVVGGAALWLICEWLWQRIPVVALVVALAVITGLVWVVRRVRRAEDLQTTVVAVLVGLFVTVSPAALLLVGR